MPRNKKRIPPPLRTTNIEARYGANIRLMLKPFRELVEAKLFPMLDFIAQSGPVHLDAPSDDINRVFEQIRIAFAQTFSDRTVDRVAQESATLIDNINHKTFRRQTQTVLGVDPVFAEPWLADEIDIFVSENASLVKSVPTEHLADIEQMVFREAKRRSSPTEIKNKIIKLFGNADTSAALIARDQVSKFNGRLSELRQTAAGVDKYTWRTSEDGRVRSFSNSGGYSSHAKLNGKVFSWKNPPVTVFRGKRAGERNHPGQDINCRCYAEPVLDKLIGGLRNAA